MRRVAKCSGGPAGAACARRWMGGRVAVEKRPLDLVGVGQLLQVVEGPAQAGNEATRAGTSTTTACNRRLRDCNGCRWSPSASAPRTRSAPPRTPRVQRDDTATARCRRWLCSRTQRLSWLALIAALARQSRYRRAGPGACSHQLGLGRLVVHAAAIALATDHKSASQLFHTL